MPIFSPGKPRTGCFTASTEAAKHQVAIASPYREATGRVCPVTDCKRARRSASSREASPHAFSLLTPPALGNSRSHLPPGIIPADFHPNRCYSAPARKKQTTIFPCSRREKGHGQTKRDPDGRRSTNHRATSTTSAPSRAGDRRRRCGRRQRIRPCGMCRSS